MASIVLEETLGLREFREEGKEEEEDGENMFLTLESVSVDVAAAAAVQVLNGGAEVLL